MSLSWTCRDTSGSCRRCWPGSAPCPPSCSWWRRMAAGCRSPAEHLAALDALGVAHGLLVVTRADLADPAPVMADARSRIAGTGLGPVDAVAVSARTGAGMAELRDALGPVGRFGRRRGGRRGRPAVGRSGVFRCRGRHRRDGHADPRDAAGRRRTGGVHRGRFGAGARVAVVGAGRAGGGAVARVAVSVRGKRVRLAHGDALLTAGAWWSTAEVDVVVRGDGDPLPGQLVLHIGTAAVPVRVRPLGASAARLRLGRALPLRVGDRVLLRDPGRHRVVGRADVVDVEPPELWRRAAARERATSWSRSGRRARQSGHDRCCGGSGSPIGRSSGGPGCRSSATGRGRVGGRRRLGTGAGRVADVGEAVAGRASVGRPVCR